MFQGGRHGCLICGMTFTRESNLKRHIHSVHTMPAVKCPVCSSTYSRHDNMVMHMRLKHPGHPLLSTVTTAGPKTSPLSNKLDTEPTDLADQTDHTDHTDSVE